MKRLVFLSIALVLGLVVVAVGYPPATITEVTQGSMKIGGLDCGTSYRLTLEENQGGAWVNSQQYTQATAACSTALPTADFNLAPSPSAPGQNVTFDWTGSCPASPCTFTWADETGDGPGGNTIQLGTGDTYQRAFLALGTKYIELTVVDAQGRSVSSPIRQHAVQSSSSPPSLPLPPSDELLWPADLSGHAIGFRSSLSNPYNGFKWGDCCFAGGGFHDIQFTSDGATKAIRSALPSGSGTQRAEAVPAWDPCVGQCQGQTYWVGFDLYAPVLPTAANWGPLLLQQQRDPPGNGTISLHMVGNQMHLQGASGIPSQGSNLNLGTLTSARTRIVMGVFLHETNGWVEAWRDGQLVGRVEPWVSDDTSNDGPGTRASTLPAEYPNLGVWLKFGAYRGGGSSPLDARYSDLRVATTRAGVM
jgi:hypothetical protein